MTSMCRPWVFKIFSDLDWLSVFLKGNKEIFVSIFQVQNRLILTNKKGESDRWKSHIMEVLFSTVYHLKLFQLDKMQNH
jgi:hypothetical protein